MCSSSRHYEHLTIESSHDAFLRSHRRIPPRTSLSTSRRTEARSCCARSASLCASWSYVAPEYPPCILFSSHRVVSPDPKMSFMALPLSCRRNSLLCRTVGRVPMELPRFWSPEPEWCVALRPEAGAG